jgi:hypothetical protein
MNKKSLLFVVTALGLILLAGCGTPETSNQPWDKPIQADNRPGYKSADSPPLMRDSRQ